VSVGAYLSRLNSFLMLPQAVGQAMVEFVTESVTCLVIELGIVSPNAFSGGVVEGSHLELDLNRPPTLKAKIMANRRDLCPPRPRTDPARKAR
jgi:hypothetical protein